MVEWYIGSVIFTLLVAGFLNHIELEKTGHSDLPYAIFISLFAPLVWIYVLGGIIHILLTPKKKV